MGSQTRPLQRGDRWLLRWLMVFTFTSWVMEMYIVLGVDLAQATDPCGRLFYFYAREWDPIFLRPPAFLWLMCCFDAFVFGTCYLCLCYAWVRRRPWLRGLTQAYVPAMLYSTALYFGFEWMTQREEANLTMVTIVNGPYVVVPIWLWLRVHKQPLFA